VEIEKEMQRVGFTPSDIKLATDQLAEDAEKMEQALEGLSPAKTSRKEAEKKLGALALHPMAAVILEAKGWPLPKRKLSALPPGRGLDMRENDSAEISSTLIQIAKEGDDNPKLPDARATVRIEEDMPVYLVSPKHVEGSKSFNKARGRGEGVGVIPDDHIDLYRQAVKDEKGDLWAQDANRVFHRFQNKNGIAHWNGATGGPKNPDPIPLEKVPPEIKKHFQK